MEFPLEISKGPWPKSISEAQEIPQYVMDRVTERIILIVKTHNNIYVVMYNDTSSCNLLERCTFHLALSLLLQALLVQLSSSV